MPFTAGVLNAFFQTWDPSLKNENCCLGMGPYYNSPAVFTQERLPTSFPPIGSNVSALNVLNNLIITHFYYYEIWLLLGQECLNSSSDLLVAVFGSENPL